MSLTLGILGGMGPDATADLFVKITRATPARCDQEHLRVLIDSNPKIPDRAAALCGRGPDPRPAMIASARNLVRAGADFIAVPCNTAHAFYDDLVAAVPVPVLHMIKEVAVWRRLVYPGARSVGLLATAATIRTGLYHRELARDGVAVLVPDELHQRALMRAIYGPESVKTGNYGRARAWALRAGAHLLERDCDLLILGCTELPIVLRQADFDRPVIDATGVLARAAVREALGGDAAPRSEPGPAGGASPSLPTDILREVGKATPESRRGRCGDAS